MISKTQLKVKRIFDVAVVLVFLPLLIIPILLLVLIATIDTKQWGIYSQLRVGQYGKLFRIYKLRTLADGAHQLGQLDHLASSMGRFLRQSKLNELPQLFNVLIGDMSLVGPRPDLQGFADELKGEDRIILKVKPGITGPASLKYRHEEQLLAVRKDPEHYNRTIIWADKVKINKNYVQNYSFYLDLTLILKSILNK
ncbi:sugar transferase [Winogradskyella sp. F6397]|uniref:Sugar transferase n=1 Tax=Winogradskyella marina TaxID=2785530 RepID=A0ABS0EKH6_9FLAO|nr:sugar transferase [Winogradskyella marina]MBF8150964.1 sugar transferase [Winogradskyella marina]